VAKAVAITKDYLLHQSASLGLEPRPHQKDGALARSDALHLSIRSRALQSKRTAHDFCRSSDDRAIARTQERHPTGSEPGWTVSGKSGPRSEKDLSSSNRGRARTSAIKTKSASRSCSGFRGTRSRDGQHSRR